MKERRFRPFTYNMAFIRHINGILGLKFEADSLHSLCYVPEQTQVKFLFRLYLKFLHIFSLSAP